MSKSLAKAMSSCRRSRVVCGDTLRITNYIDLESIDAVVCDPPYGLRFMGQAWDHGVPGEIFWRRILRVAKPGAYLLAFGGTRTYHRLACAIEDAGWEIRDCLSWMYGSGFPKSHDISKAIDKRAGVWRGRRGEVVGGSNSMSGPRYERNDKGDPVTDAAKQWDGWGTGLKPAWEPIILARKPMIGTVAANVLAHGTGGINVDGCRIGMTKEDFDKLSSGVNKIISRGGKTKGWKNSSDLSGANPANSKGRWPANLLLDEESAKLLDAQSGQFKGQLGMTKTVGGHRFIQGDLETVQQFDMGNTDFGGASRFFYIAKASKSERNRGLKLTEHPTTVTKRKPGSAGQMHARAGVTGSELRGNTHPTVKPVDLMRYLCRLVCPKGGIVLDPFCGSGSTGVAAKMEGMRFVGIEKEQKWARIARKRIAKVVPSMFDFCE